MPDTGHSNIELAHHLSEHRDHGERSEYYRTDLIEIAEALVLGNSCGRDGMEWIPGRPLDWIPG
jgi:hypothetical protein